MHCLYPSIKPYTTHELTVGHPHVLYLEEIGNPNGVPVIALHTGPGAGIDPNMRRLFDPELYRIILFDQRGCGRSTPSAEISQNSTQDLLDDIEVIREHLQLDAFVICGGGWGALLALLYAETYPHYIKALLLYQIYLGRPQDIAWFYQTGASQIYPEDWQEFTGSLPEDSLSDIPKHYFNCLIGKNEVARMSAAKNWALWHARCSGFEPHSSMLEQYTDPHFACALALLASYYITNNYFIEENVVLKNIHKIRHLKTYLIHARYDMICPLEGAWSLHQALPASSFRIVRETGPVYQNSGMIEALIEASKAIVHQDLEAS